jgi:ABC-type transporter Mla subunit MlaD
MKESRINAVIALSTVVAAVLMLAALSFAIGKWTWGQHRHELIIRFPNASGINANSEVKFAGAPSGRVKLVRLIKREDQTLDPVTKQFNCVEVVAEVDANLEIGEDVEATIKQDGLGISAKYILLTPGPDHNSKDLADGAEIQGKEPFDLTDLLQPAGDALTQAKELVSKLAPTLDRLDSITVTLQSQLPPLMNHADRLMKDGDSVLANLNTPEDKQRINDTLANLRVSTENLKVVSSNAKALTATLAQKPWRVFWGGATITAPPETQVLKSDTAIPLKPDVDVNSSTPVTPASAPAKKKSE